MTNQNSASATAYLCRRNFYCTFGGLKPCILTTSKQITNMRRFMLFVVIGLAFLQSYADIPNGYYNQAENCSGPVLKTKLNEIIEVGTRLSYGSGTNNTWWGFYITDQRPDGSVWDMYSTTVRYFGDRGNSVGGMNIEHSFAKSWWGGSKNDAYKDLYHLNPSDSEANSRRGSYPMGIVESPAHWENGSIKVGDNTYGNDYSSWCFEPEDQYKGDFARAYFYMATCYEDLTWAVSQVNAQHALSGDHYKGFKDWYIDLLLEWHRNDPVSQKEIDRQEAIYSIQHNRNPFIDYPCLVEYIWGNKEGESVDFNTLMSTSNPDYMSSNDKSGCTCEITTPTLTSPRSGSIVEVGNANLNETVSKSIEVVGVLVSENVQVSLSGSNANCFTINKNTFTAAELLDTASLTISYHPTALGEHTATLTFSSNELSRTTTVEIKGQCLAQLSEPVDADYYFATSNASEAQTKRFTVKGTNLASDITLSISGISAANFVLSETQLDKDLVMAGVEVVLTYLPAIGNQEATLSISSTDFETRAIGLHGVCSFSALEATDITNNGFTANWTNANVDNYVLDVYSKTVSGNEPVLLFEEETLSTEVVNSNDYLSTSGTVYDETSRGALRLGTGSGDGSLVLKNIDAPMGGTIYVKAQAYNNDASVLLVKHGSEILLEQDLSSNIEEYVIGFPALTESETIVLSQGVSDERVNLYAIRVEVGGETIVNVSVNGFPCSVGDVQEYAVTGLAHDTYYYTVTPQGLPVSEEITVRLDNGNSLVPTEHAAYQYYIYNGTLEVLHLGHDATVRLYDMYGRLLANKYHQMESCRMEMGQRGVYLLQIEENNQKTTIKLIY